MGTVGGYPFPMAIPADEDWRRRVIERAKELDHEHRRQESTFFTRLLSHVVRLHMLRAIAKGWLVPPKAGETKHVPRPLSGRVSVTFVGHATTLLSTEASRLIVDPYFPDTLWTMRRRELACLHPRDREEVGVILITHAHPDRLHRDSLRRFSRGATLLVPPKCGNLVRGLGFHHVEEVPPGEARVISGVEITVVAAKHDGRRLGVDHAD